MLTQVVAGRVYDYSHCVGEYMGGMEWPGEGFALPIAAAVGEGDVVYVLSRGMEAPATATRSRRGRSAYASASSTCRRTPAARST